MPFPSFSIAAAPTLRIEFSEGDNNVMFLYPSVLPEETPIGDTAVAGNVILTLPTARKVSLVTVELLGQQRFQFRKKARSVETLRKVVTVNVNGEQGSEEELPAGEHTFAFSINVPANIAPSLNMLGETDYDVIARIPRLGRLGGALICTRPIGMFVNHSGKHNGFPPPHSWSAQYLHDCLGPVQIETASKHFMIGGYLRWTITWAEYLLPFKITDLTVEIVQTFTITPSLDVSEPCEKYSLRYGLYKLKEDGSWPTDLSGLIRPGDSPACVSRQVRVPYENGKLYNNAPRLTPSHHPASLSCITPSTQIVLTLTFEQYEGGSNPTQDQLERPTIQKMQVQGNAVLSSCFLRREYMELPPYIAEGDSKEECHQNIPKGAYGFSQCMCKEMTAEEEAEYGISEEEMRKLAQAEEAARAWLRDSRAAKAVADG